METQLGHEKNADQIAYWNGPGGKRWSDRQAMQDILREQHKNVVEAVRAGKLESILDPPAQGAGQ